MTPVSRATLSALLFPATPRCLPCERGINIAFRSLHLVAMGILLGGHAFEVAPERLRLWLVLTGITGAGLMGMELYRSCQWAYQGMGVAVWIKLALVAAAGLWWDQRVALLVLAAVIASVGSHMPGPCRHFSLLHGRVLDEDGEGGAEGAAAGGG
jgi:hypothetical protein